jgi:hypothetical protein
MVFDRIGKLFATGRFWPIAAVGQDTKCTVRVRFILTSGRDSNGVNVGSIQSFSDALASAPITPT